MLNQRKACHIFSPADKIESVWAYITEGSEIEHTQGFSTVVALCTCRK